MGTTTKPPAASMYHALFSSIWSQVLWTLSALDHSVKSSDQITLFLVKAVPVTTGPSVITLKALNWSTLSSMLCVRRLNLAIAFKAFNLHTLWVAVPGLVWVPF